jgi:hypothetical protein
VRRLALAGVVLCALAAPALAQAALHPAVARPNPALVGIRLDYVNPLHAPDGSTASLEPLSQAVITAATDDLPHFRFIGDLGGFRPAPVGRTTVVGWGRTLLPLGRYESELPLYRVTAGGISTFMPGGASTPPPGPPDNGLQQIPGMRVPPPVPPPTQANTTPPANQGFGGVGGPPGGPTGTVGGGTTTQHPQPPPATTTRPTTTAPDAVTTAIATTATATDGGGGGGGLGGAGACGVPGISITSDQPGCVLTVARARPGDSVSEVMTVRNTSGSSYTLSLEAVGPNDNHLWQDLQMAVYELGTPPPAPFPPLLYWLAGFNDLTMLADGQSVTYVIVLYLPLTAGNADMGESAVVGFRWRALG